jgi:hypothetical protein
MSACRGRASCRRPFRAVPRKSREYRDAFLNLKQKSKLYQSNPGGVTFVSSSLFQANIHIPADIPNGTHTIRAVPVQDRQIGRREVS